MNAVMSAPFLSIYFFNSSFTVMKKKMVMVVKRRTFWWYSDDVDRGHMCGEVGEEGS